MKVLVIIPAYNEEESIAGVIEELKACGTECDYVVINDCSTDRTPEILEERGYNFVSLPVNLGIGGAVQTGFRYACENGYDIAVQYDGDGQHDPAYLGALIAPIINGECDFSLGTRFIEKAGFQTSFMRRVGINFLKCIIFISCGERVSDATAGFRAASKELIRYFSEHYAQDYPEPEAVISAVTEGFRIKEVPVVMRERQGGVSSISPLKSVYYMLKVSVAVLMYRFARRNRRKR